MKASLFFIIFAISTPLIANDLCNKGVRFEGNCEKMISVYEYDPKEGICIEREGSGCTSENGFVGQAECLEVCQGSRSLFERISDKTQEKLSN